MHLPIKKRMQYKKAEALLEIENVKDMIKSGDYLEAKARLLQVKKLSRGLDGISEMITVTDILCSFEFDIWACGCDWFRILQVWPDADQSVIQDRYNKFITKLEPISTTFPGAKLALETVEKAFAVLSDPGKRLEFDKKSAASLNGRVITDASSVANKPCDEKFYDFSKARTATDYAVGQVWAASDNENMPRKYAIISSMERSPFTMHVNWLKPDPDLQCEIDWCKAGLPVVCGFFRVNETHQTIISLPGSFSHAVSRGASQNDRIKLYPRKHEVWAIYRDWEPFEWILNPEAKNTCKLQIVEILTGYSDHEDMLVVRLVKVKGFKTVFKRYTENGIEQTFTIPGRCLYMFSHSVPAYRFVAGERSNIFKGMLHLDPLAIPDLLDCTPELDTNTTAAAAAAYPEAKPVKNKWSAKDFVSGQVWGVLDGFDSMPRQYVLVDNLVSVSVVKVSNLEPQPILNQERYWVEQKLPVACGLFRVGKTALHMKISQFSNLVNCEFITNGSFYKIYPRKGEIWVMYKDWDSKWKKSDFSSYKCGIVEIITDFSIESGLLVARLEEVPGCATFFRRQKFGGFELSSAVPRTEMLSFSHKIAAFTVPGIGVYSIPEGSWHLEVNSLPQNHRE